MQMSDVDQRVINTLRFLSADQVEKAKSGHPGMPLGAAPMAYALWDQFLRFNPRNPDWINRDRFILSAGHGSALLYSLLHLYGYEMPLSELQRFRQWESKTPGHPEFGCAPGVEVTTGPLGQGFAMGIGMAIAEQYLAALFNKPGFPLIDHCTYALVSDGDLMEGMSSEAASLAGHLKLGKLIYLYDSNRITIEGSTDLAFSENVLGRFEAYDWHVQTIPDGNNIAAIAAAITHAQHELSKPSLIIIKTHIGYGSPKQDTAAVHGEPLGAEALKSAKKNLQWPLEPEFYMPEEVLAHCREAGLRGANLEHAWQVMFAEYRTVYPGQARLFDLAASGQLPDHWQDSLPFWEANSKPLATRAASGKVINALASKIPFLIGGSADLAPSNKTLIEGAADFSAGERNGRNLHFGVREHAMMASLNGMARHGGIIPYGATFLIFSDYMRPALRLAALMQTRVILVFTHDSICLGEDGPTHQPIEHLISLRAIPGLVVIRPADANETVAAWQIALQQKRPVALILTRQDLPVLTTRKEMVLEGIARGAYSLREPEGGSADIELIASGSEVHLILAAEKELRAQGLRARVVSMPSWELFDEQPLDYRQSLLPKDLPKLAVEAGSHRGWRDYVGDNGEILGLDRFGASAPAGVLYERLGFTVEAIVQKVKRLLSQR